jgi:DNA-binding transcriptional LysR family regulator
MASFPNLDPNNLIVFYIVATEKSLTSAAEKLFLTQPAVTYRLKCLEEYTRVKLLDIKKHRVQLTPSGEEVFKYAREIYQQLVGAERFIKSIRESNLRVGIAGIYNAIVSPVLNAIFEKPKSGVKLTVESGNAFEMVQNVVDSRLDLAIVPHFSYGFENLKSIAISNPMKLICFAGQDQKIKKPVLDWKDIIDYPLVSGPQTSVVRRVIEDRLKAEGIDLQPLAAEVDDIEWCITLVEHGKGLSFSFFYAIENKLAEGKLKTVPLSEDIFIAADAIMPDDMFINPILENFLSMVKEAFIKVESQ